MTTQPLVSIIIPCYNQARYIPDAVESLRKQVHEHWEAILVNDGSTDDTRAVVQKLTADDPRLKYIEQENRGLAGARNTGLDHASGDYIQFLDADDLLFPDKLSKQLELMCQTPDPAVSYCRPFFCQGDDTKTEISANRPFPLLDTGDAPADLAFRWERGLSIPPHCFLFDARLFAEPRIRFDESLPNHEDWECWMRVFTRRPAVYFADEKLVVYRRHAASMCRDEDLMRRGFLQALTTQRDAHRDAPEIHGILDRRIRYLTFSKEKEEPVDLPWRPLVSVIVTSYNYEQYIEECLRSVFNQTYRRVELIVVDDGSTDRSCEIITRMLSESPFPAKRIFKSNGGQASACNAGFLQATGEVVSFLDSDDTWRPDRVERVVDFMHEFPGGGVYQHQLDTGKGLKRHGLLSADVFAAWKRWGAGEFNILDDSGGALFSPFLPTTGLAFRREVLDKVFPIPVQLITCPDAFLTRTAVAYGPLLSMPAVLGRWRDHTDNAGKGGFGGPRKYWVPVVMPAINTYYERRKLGLRLKEDAIHTSAVDASRVLGEGTFSRASFKTRTSAPTEPRRTSPAYHTLRRTWGNFFRVFLSERRVRRIRRFFYGEEVGTSKGSTFLVGAPAGKMAGKALRSVFGDRVVAPMRRFTLRIVKPVTRK